MDQMVGCIHEPVSAVFEGMGLKHLQHFRTGALHNGDACRKCGSDVEWENWMFGGGRARSLFGDDVAEVRDDGTRNPVAPEFGIVREWQRHPAHQKEAVGFQR